MKCLIDYTVDGQKVRTTVKAPTTVQALMRLLETLPEGTQVKAIVRAVKEPH